MTEKDTDQFKIRLDDEYEEHAIKEKEDFGEGQTKNLNQRTLILIIFITCLVGVLLALAYVDLKKRINNIHTTGSTQVQNLSQNVDSRLSDLSTQTKTFKDLIDTETASLKKEIDFLTVNLDKNKTYLKKSEKTGKKAFEKSISSIHKKIASMEKNLKSLDTRLSAIDGYVKRELTKFGEILNQIEKELTSTKSDISFLSKKRIEQEKVDLAHDIQQKRFNQELDQTKKYMDSRLIEIKKKIQALEHKSPPLTTTGSTPSSPPPPKDSGGIIEQDISE